MTRHVHCAYGAPFSQVPRFMFGRSAPALGSPYLTPIAAPIPITRTGVASGVGGVDYTRIGRRRPFPVAAYGGPSLRGPYQEAEASTSDWLSQYAPAINAVVTTVFDPRREAARLRVRLEQARARGASQATIRKLEEQLAVVEQAAMDKQSQVAQGQLWQEGITRNLWVVTGLGVALIGFVGVATWRTGRGARRRNGGRGWS